MNNDKEFIDKTLMDINFYLKPRESLQYVIDTVRKSCEVIDEIAREPIENALYSTGRFSTEQSTELAEGILQSIKEHGLKIINSSAPIQETSNE